MTLLDTVELKCIKCGKISEQDIIISLHISKSTDKEGLKDFIKHLQKCPYCGYESSNISKNFNNFVENNNA